MVSGGPGCGAAASAFAAKTLATSAAQIQRRLPERSNIRFLDGLRSNEGMLAVRNQASRGFATRTHGHRTYLIPRSLESGVTSVGSLPPGVSSGPTTAG